MIERIQIDYIKFFFSNSSVICSLIFLSIEYKQDFISLEIFLISLMNQRFSNLINQLTSTICPHFSVKKDEESQDYESFITHIFWTKSDEILHSDRVYRSLRWQKHQGKLTSKSIAAKCPEAEQARQSYRKIISSWSGSEEDPKPGLRNFQNKVSFTIFSKLRCLNHLC